MASLVAQTVKRLPTMRETWVRSPGLGRSPGERNGNPLHYSCLENPMDQGAWWATVYRVTKSWTRLSHFTSRHFNGNSKFNLMDYGDAQSELQGQRWGTKCTHLIQGPREACTRVRPRVRVEQRVQAGGLVGRLGQQGQTRVWRMGP